MTSKIFSSRVLGLALVGALCFGCKDDGDGSTTGDETTGSTGTSTSTTVPLTTDSTTTDASSSSTTEEAASSSSTSEAVESSSSSSTGDPMGLPDIDMSLVVVQMAASVFTDTENFSESSCPLSEECVGGSGDRRLLHFSTITPNVGEGDFIVGSPNLEPEKFEWGECHGHWHFKDFAEYRLLDSKRRVVATGHKMSFALIDLTEFWKDAGPSKYPLNDGTQGISLGWADVYHWGLDCQWVDITGVPPGDYLLEVSINPAQVVEELSYDNNIALIPVTITEEDTGMPSVPKTWTCNPGYYASIDGCDCGCGDFDPDCSNPTVDACEYCDNDGSCAEVGGCGAINPNDNSTCE